MAYNAHRANIRNAMVPMTLTEATFFRAGMIAAGDADGAGYADEFMRDYAEDFAEMADDEGCTGDDDCRCEHGCEG